MPYTQLYYHIIWATKYRQPVLTPPVEEMIYGFIRQKAADLGSKVFALNGWLEHTHLVCSIHAKIAVSDFVRQIKGHATYHYNRNINPEHPIHWQTDYAAFTIDPRSLQKVIRYVERQKGHHGKNTTDVLREWDGSRGRGK